MTKTALLFSEINLQEVKNSLMLIFNNLLTINFFTSKLVLNPFIYHYRINLTIKKRLNCLPKSTSACPIS